MSKPERAYRRREIAGKPLAPESLVMSYGYDPLLSEGAIKPPIFQTSTFAFRSAEQGEMYFRKAAGRAVEGDLEDPGLAYTRINNPDLEVLEDRLTLYDGSEEALAFSSGMGAITTSLLAFLEKGQAVLHSSPIYGATEVFIRNILPRYGIETGEFFAPSPEDEIEAAALALSDRAPVAVIYTETPANPTNVLVDLAACARVADRLEQKTGVRPVIMTDNTMLGPIGQAPLGHGADIVLYSLTKYVGGHSDLIAGAALGSSEHMAKIRSLRTALGTTPDPHTCWLLMRSLETVRLRMERAFENAKVCAAFLRDHPKVERVRFLDFLPEAHPQRDVFDTQCMGPGSTFSFDVAGGKAAAFKMLDSLKLIKLAVSLGGTESLMCHPGSTTHSGVPPELQEKLGFTPGLVRFSVGIENADDLVTDLEQALAAV